MMLQRMLRVVMFAIVLSVAAAGRADAQGSIEAARGLYAAAEYTEALNMLDGLLARVESPDERETIELYRTLCLVAVGRRGDADRAIERIIGSNPLYRPSADEIPPRLRLAFTEARRRLLPAMIQQGYLDAKAAFDRQDFAAAAIGFKRVSDVLADPDLADMAAQSPLSDLRTLATGFHDLSAKAIAPPPPAPVSAPAAAPVARVDAARTYQAGRDQVVAPVTIRQVLPPYPGTVTRTTTGVLEVTIDESGAVESAEMVTSVTAGYDRLVLSAARSWQYRPATMGGKPVKFVKRIEVRLSAPPR